MQKTRMSTPLKSLNTTMYTSMKGSFMSSNEKRIKTNPFDKYTIITKLSDSPYPSYLLFDEEYCKHVKIKIFFLENGEKSPLYIRERLIDEINHDNIVSGIKCIDYHDHFDHKCCKPFSAVIQEFASQGSLTAMMSKNLIDGDRVILLSYLNQLIYVIAHLHQRGMAHLNLSTDTIYLGDEFQIKLSDFEYSVTNVLTKITTRGRPNYRSLELKSKLCKDPMAADIYALGCVFFVLYLGCLPYNEDVHVEGYDLYNLVLKGDFKEYWKKFEELHDHKLVIEDSFKELFEKMVDPVPEKRIKVDDLRDEKFFKGTKFYTKTEIRVVVDHRFKVRSHLNY